jgi:cobalt/nickel transport system ATP-binding protein
VTSPAIRVEDLSFTYPDGTAALQAVSLDVAAGEAVGIVGPNGAGKSTLVNHLNGYHLPRHGRVVIQGRALDKRTVETIRREVGVVFQHPDDQLFLARLYDDVAFGPTNLGLAAGEVAERVQRVLADLGLWELREKPSFALSQGQKHFAALATVLAMRPSVIVFDEPTADLDPRNRRRLLRLVRALPATRVVVSHDLDFVWDTCDRVMIMAAGRLVAVGPAHELLAQRDLLEAHGLELPLRLQR